MTTAAAPIETWHARIGGRVQGVGYREFCRNIRPLRAAPHRVSRAAADLVDCKDLRAVIDQGG